MVDSILLAIGFETSISYAESHYREVEHSMINEQKQRFPDRYKNYPGELLYTTHHQIDYCYVSQGDRYSWVANKGLPEYELISFKGHNHFAVTLHRAVGSMLSVSNGSIRRPQAGPSIPTPGAQCQVNVLLNFLLGLFWFKRRFGYMRQKASLIQPITSPFQFFTIFLV